MPTRRLPSITKEEKAMLKSSPWSTVVGHWLSNATEQPRQEIGVLMQVLLLGLCALSIKRSKHTLCKKVKIFSLYTNNTFQIELGDEQRYRLDVV